MSTIAKNPSAYHDFEILQSYEAGIQLTGAEVKSAKTGRIQLKDSFAKVLASGEVYLINAYIAPYQQASDKDYDPYRSRKLLLHRDQITEIKQSIAGSGLTIVPLKMYNVRRGLIKLELALAKGKRQFEKRRVIEERDSRRHIERTLKRHQ
jgi:SsrA-binding protein